VTGVLARRELRLFLAADALSLVGTGALWLALAIWAKSLTGSNAAAGMVIFAVLAPPVLLAPAAGLLVDRVRRRRLLIAVNLATAGVVCLLLLVRGPDQVALLYVVAALYGCSDALVRPAQSALLRTLVPVDGELAAANGALQTLVAVARLLSPVAGAGLFAAVGPSAVVLLDVATFVAAAGMLAALPVAEPAPRPGEASWRTEVTAGLAHLRRTVVLRQVVGAVALAMLVIGFIETVTFAVADAGLHRPPAFVGVLDLGFGAGSVLGGLVTARLVRRLGPGGAVTAGLAVSALGMALLGLPLAPAAVLGMAVIGWGVPPIVAGLMTTLQQLTPTHLQGRAHSAVAVVIGTPQSLSIALGAVLVAGVDHRVLLGVMTVGMLLAAGWLRTRREQRVRPAEPAHTEAEPARAA
jgi:Na+/melibiose symporter-like transporter